MTSHSAPAGPRRILATGLAGAGLLLLAGCAVDGANAQDLNSNPAPGTTTGSTGAGTYADGTYTTVADYVAPSGAESVSVTITLADGVITQVSASGDAVDREAIEFQDRFARGIAAEVVGKDIAGLSVSRVSGSSLTSAGFNTALDEIRADALA